MTDGEHSFNAGLGTVRNVVDKVLGSHHVQRPINFPIAVFVYQSISWDVDLPISGVFSSEP